MSHKKIFLLLGHPDKSGMCGRLADAYEQGAKDGGHEIERLNIGEMQFDPNLHHGYRSIQELEPDLKKFEELMEWADHFVIIHPIWWYGMPAVLKGLFDRAWLPGSAFRYIKDKEGKPTMFWQRLYKGKTAHIIVTSGSWAALIRLFPGAVNAQLKWGILWFAGISARTTWFSPAENVPEPKCTAWCDRVHEFGREGA